MYLCIVCICVYVYVLNVLHLCMCCIYSMHVHVYFKDMSHNTFIYMHIQAIHAYMKIHTRDKKSPNVCIGMYVMGNTFRYIMTCSNTYQIRAIWFTYGVTV
jgi:hypothetical protein